MAVSPARPKGPPLNALRAFEAAARRGGFVQAAEELGVTPGAISQHVRTLEDWAGTALFTRRAHGVQLTPAGRDLLPGLTAAFDRIGHSVRGLRATRSRHAIHIAALPAVAQLWLSPRLPALRDAMADRTVSVTALETPPNLARELFDFSLFLRPPGEAAFGTVLAEDRIFPVCAPAVAARLSHPADLTRVTLLHDEAWPEDWRMWARATGTRLADAEAGPRFSLYALALDAAVQGVGVLMGHSGLVGAALERGELVAPFDAPVATGRALVLDRPGPARPRDGTEALIAALR